MPYEPGEVVVIKFPFTNQVGAKQRPAIVVSSRDYNKRRPDTMLIAVTSQIKPARGYGEVLINDWQRAGLLKESVIKPVIFTAEQRLIRKSLGKLSGRDQEALLKLIEQIVVSKQYRCSSEVYLLDPKQLETMGLEINHMTRDNCYQCSPEHQGKTREEKQKLWDKLKRDIKEHGFSRDYPIEVELRRRDGKDKVLQGHHRLSIANELKLREVPVRFVW